MAQPRIRLGLEFDNRLHYHAFALRPFVCGGYRHAGGRLWQGTSKLHFYVGNSGFDKLAEVAERNGIGERMRLSRVNPFEKFTACHGRYTVLPLPADHAQNTSPSECEGKRLLYAHDTGMFSEAIWQGLRTFGRFDLVSLDCTGCLGLGGDWERGHMSVGSNLRTSTRMKKEGIADGNTVFVLNHFSHNGGQTYDELIEAITNTGFVVAYDGKEIAF